jgi:hypothetical protein
VSCGTEGTRLSKWLVGKKAVASALGMSVSTVERYLKRYPDFPAHRRGRTIFVSPDALTAWIEHRGDGTCPTCGGGMPREAG